MKNKVSKNVEEDFLKDAEAALNAELSDVKVRITTMIDSDVLAALKKSSEEKHIKYQTYLNQILRSALFDKENRIDKIEKEIKEIKSKLA